MGNVGSTPTSTALWSGTLKQGAPCALYYFLKFVYGKEC